MATTKAPAPISYQAEAERHEQPEPGQAVVVQLVVQGWATTHRPDHVSPPDDPYDPAA